MYEPPHPGHFVRAREIKLEMSSVFRESMKVVVADTAETVVECGAPSEAESHSYRLFVAPFDMVVKPHTLEDWKFGRCQQFNS